MNIGVLFGCFGRTIDGPGLPGGLIIYQGHLFPLKGHLRGCGSKNQQLNGTLEDGHMDQSLRNPSGFILSHTYVHEVILHVQSQA